MVRHFWSLVLQSQPKEHCQAQSIIDIEEHEIYIDNWFFIWKWVPFHIGPVVIFAVVHFHLRKLASSD